jgi:hypothetical protein
MRPAIFRSLSFSSAVGGNWSETLFDGDTTLASGSSARLSSCEAVVQNSLVVSGLRLMSLTHIVADDGGPKATGYLDFGILAD